MNRYGYVGNGPVSSIDPLGLCGQSGADWLSNFSNLVSGFGYAVTGGLIAPIWRLHGTDAYIDRDSGWFRAGRGIGIVHAVATIGVGTGAAAWLGARLTVLLGGGAAAVAAKAAPDIENLSEKIVRQS